MTLKSLDLYFLVSVAWLRVAPSLKKKKKSSNIQCSKHKIVQLWGKLIQAVKWSIGKYVNMLQWKIMVTYMLPLC